MNDRTAASDSPRRTTWRDAVRGNVLMMGLVSLFTDFSSEMMNPLLPIFIGGIVPVGLAPVYLGIMEGVAEAAASILKLISGRISDALGKRKSLVILGYGLSTVCRPLIALVGAGWQIIGLKFFDRVGKGIRTSPRDALIGDSVGPEVRGLAFSFHRAMDHAGAVLGPLVSILVLYLFLGEEFWRTGKGAPSAREMTGLRVLFGIAIVPGLLAMGTLFLKVREIVPKRQSASGREGRAPGPWRQLPRRFYLFVGIVMIFALGNSSDLFIALLAKEKYGMGLLHVILLWIALHVSKIVFSIPGGVLSDRLGRRGVIVTGWIVYALVYCGLAVADNPVHFWILVVVYGFYYGMAEGAEKALVTDFVPSEHRGTAFGIYHGAVGIAALPASLLFGVFWKEIGPAWAFGIGASLAGLAAVMLIVLLSTTRKGQPGRASV